MKELIETWEKPKRALLIGVRDDRGAAGEAESLFQELEGLAETLGLEIAAREMVRLRQPCAKYGVGTGKAAELSDLARSLPADCIVLNWNVSPAQQRHWENLSGLPAMDRQELIIRIFSARARTREAGIQTALAELLYALPRLSHKHLDLSRQRGGRYGTRDAGETKLEMDRRYVRQRIQRLRQELAEVRRQRMVQRKQREHSAIPSGALVGYTNAGKSSLLNALTSLAGGQNAGVLVEDKLFATLDPTARRVETSSGKPFLLIDTVGFIRQLPHDLIDAFHATLEEVSRADFLIHVLDASDPAAGQYYATSMAALRELEADQKPMIIALNKTDKAGAGFLAGQFPNSVPISALRHTGLTELLGRMEELRL
ncbi:MAG: GTPase HflX [Treponema sp.]|jgi:GTP-binding protein HflX|nr:GTPase HflX [Treponema sp.]